MGINMTEHERALLDLLFRAAQANPHYIEVAPQIDALLRTVRATALRGAAGESDYAFVSNWLFDRADNIETGAARIVPTPSTLAWRTAPHQRELDELADEESQ